MKISVHMRGKKKKERLVVMDRKRKSQTNSEDSRQNREFLSKAAARFLSSHSRFAIANREWEGLSANNFPPTGRCEELSRAVKKRWPMASKKMAF